GQQAKQQIDEASYDFVAGGAGSELTLRANREAFQKISIMPRVLKGIKQVDTACYSAIVLTVDLPVLGIRDRNVRYSFTLPKDLNRLNVQSERFAAAKRGLEALTAGIKDDLSWDDYEWTRKHTTLPVLVKGILSPDDAEEAAKRKVPAIIVSNHGGRQLDTGFGAIEALLPIVERAKGKTKVLFDSGIRRGTDVFKALALGAEAVGVGRPVLWG